MQVLQPSAVIAPSLAHALRLPLLSPPPHPTRRPPPGHTDFEQRQLLMLFTCSKCNTRAAKAFSKQAYESVRRGRQREQEGFSKRV